MHEICNRRRPISMLLPIAICLTAVSGCNMGWYRESTTESEFNQDRYQCEQDAARMYPVAMAPTGPGYQSPSQTDCTSYNGQTSCTTMPGMYSPAPLMDANLGNRNNAFDWCLKSKGYTYKMEFKK